MINQYLKERWITLASTYTSDEELINNLWREIEISHSQKKRYYHNLTHLNYMFVKADEFKKKIDDYEALSFSIFYHDFVYNARKSNNEKLSADVASDRLTKLGVSKSTISKCGLQILATKAHECSTDSDLNYLLDFDLGILGEDESLYKEYTQQVRQEYSIYPDFLYKPGRKKVLTHFLDLEYIYKTSDFINTHEKQARHNLEWELNTL